MSQAKQTTIYALQLEDGKYYIGKTNNLEQRFQEHQNGLGSAWTSLHQPIKIHKVIKGSSPFEEDKVTKEYMAKYGIDNVRGGSYSEHTLSQQSKDMIQKEIWGANNQCMKCGSSGHFAGNCRVKQPSYYGKQKPQQKPYTSGDCYRCGRSSHWVDDCYASTDKYGREIDSDDDLHNDLDNDSDDDSDDDSDNYSDDSY